MKGVSVRTAADNRSEPSTSVYTGSKFIYNNSGYFILGAVIEEVTGKA